MHRLLNGKFTDDWTHVCLDPNCWKHRADAVRKVGAAYDTFLFKARRGLRPVRDPKVPARGQGERREANEIMSEDI